MVAQCECCTRSTVCVRQPLSALRGGLFSGCGPLESVAQCAVLVGFSVGVTAKTIPQCVPSAGEGAGTVRFGGFVQWGTPLKVLHGASLQRVPSAGKGTAGSPPNSNTRARRPRPSPKRPIPVASDVRPPFSGFLQRARAPRASPDGPAKLENVDPSRLRHTSPPPTTTKSKKSIPIAPSTSSCFSRSRPSPQVNSGGPRRVVPVPGAVGNFPAAKSNENQLSPEKSTAHLMVSAHSQLEKSIPIAPIVPSASSRFSSSPLPRPGREIINRARNRSRRRPSRGKRKRSISVAPAT